MLNFIPKSPKTILSPRKQTLQSSKKNSYHVDHQYQLKNIKNIYKKEPSISKYQLKDSPQVPRRKISKRKLSINKESQIDRKSTKSSNNKQEQIIQKEQIRKDSRELALQIQYNKFTTQRGEDRLQNMDGEETRIKRKIRRIRSSSFLKRENASMSENCIISDTLVKVKNQNNRLKQRKTCTFLRLDQVQQLAARQKKQFQAQIAEYQKKIFALKNKIQSNKKEFSHLFHYQLFDPLKISVSPIVEMDTESSRFKSTLKQSQIKQLNFESRTKIGRFSKTSDRKEQLTETTGPASRQDYGQQDLV